ncbi:MAG: hypothetical protein NTV22_02485, partial [bacterium]|nr:hypothetical protein [bacterium]
MAGKVSVRCEAGSGAVVRRAAEILKREVRERCGARTLAPGARAELKIELKVKAGVGTEGFRIEDAAPGVIRIAGNDPRGVVYGVGKLLRLARFDKGTFEPGAWRGTSVPEKPVRGMYFASHFHNFYHDAPIEKVERYVEELALWGCNTLAVWFDMHH